MGFRNSLGGLLRYGLGGLDFSLRVSFELWSEFGGKACFFAVAPGGDVPDFGAEPVEITQASSTPSGVVRPDFLMKPERARALGIDLGLVFGGCDIIRWICPPNRFSASRVSAPSRARSEVRHDDRVYPRGWGAPRPVLTPVGITMVCDALRRVAAESAYPVN